MKSPIPFLPRRGNLRSLPEKLRPHELFYVIDYKLLGVADKDGKPQLLVNVEDLDLKSNLQKGEKGKLYKEVTDNYLYTYNGSSYEKVNMGLYQVEVRLK